MSCCCVFVSIMKCAHLMCLLEHFSVNRANGTKGSIKGETLDDDDNSDEGDEEDYTVYECHGLAPVSFQQNVCDLLCSEMLSK